MSRGMEYDEIWTYFNYSLKDIKCIFTELNVPNNHPLNSFLIKIFYSLTEIDILSIRAPAFISGILLIPLTGFITWCLSKNLYAVFFSILFISSSGVAVHYSQTGRGYSIQTFFVAAFIASIIYYEQKKRSGAKVWIPFSMAFLSVVFATLTLPTTPLFIVPVIFCHIVFIALRDELRFSIKSLKDFISKNRGTILLYTSVGACWLIWYLINFKNFAGQATGSDMNGNTLGAVLTFIIDIIEWIPGWSLVVLSLSIFFLKRNIRLAIAGILIIAFPLVIGILTHTIGPMRVYMALAPIFVVIAACGAAGIMDHFHISSKKYLNILLPGIIAAFFVNMMYPDLERWSPTDWKIVTPQIMKAFPESVYISYPSGDGYPIKFNCFPAVMEDNMKRIAFLGEKFLQVKCKDISVIHMKTKCEEHIKYKGSPPLELNLAGEYMYLYSMEKLSDKPASNIIIAVIRPILHNEAKKLIMRIVTDDWRLINNFFAEKTESNHIGYVFAIPVEKVDIQKLKQLENENPILNFYYLDGLNPE